MPFFSASLKIKTWNLMRWSFFDKFHVWVNEQLVNQHQYQHWKKVERGSGGGGDKDPKKWRKLMIWSNWKAVYRSCDRSSTDSSAPQADLPRECDNELAILSILCLHCSFIKDIISQKCAVLRCRGELIRRQNHCLAHLKGHNVNGDLNYDHINQCHWINFLWAAL